jgi:hypothetical protein
LEVFTVALVVAATLTLPGPALPDGASATVTPTNSRFPATHLDERSKPCQLGGLHYMWFPAGSGRQQLCQLVRLQVAKLIGL